ncbi:DNA-binding domain-containing protein [Mitsuaria sp. GD03876]|uniref:DNA-binding domain-containing protein n=1 Tax=Mitsuaria sp. GD03876 TaxID=2975399 RepID=UPI002449CA72|nr:DNA-binding domain-containing protein [Mitsuaria sp. GD03876]MDH0863846.1 DNA-binding domain-containing protein [Mitsuaria sp. GD03876]
MNAVEQASRLLDLQRSLQDYLIGQPSLIDTRLRRGSGLPAERRLSIYHHAYRARLHDTLADSYGHTRRYLGDEWFEREALAFVEVHGSAHFSLRWYGADFASWLSRRWPDDGEIAELAALDWALRSAFDAGDAPVLTMPDLAALAPEDWAELRLQLPPSFGRLKQSFNTLALWQALDGDETPPAAQALATPLDLLIWRRGHSPHFRSLGPLESLALNAVASGRTFAETCADLAEARPELNVAAEMGMLLRRWVDEELLAR